MENTENSKFNDISLLEAIRKNSGAHYKSQFIAIAMGDRFFYEIKKDRVHTSWSIIGAKRFSPGRPKDLEAVIKKLVARKKQFQLQLFDIQPMALPGETKKVTGEDVYNAMAEVVDTMNIFFGIK